MRAIRLNHQPQSLPALQMFRSLLLLAAIVLLAVSWSQKLQLEQKLAALDWQMHNNGHKQAAHKSLHELEPLQLEQAKHASIIMDSLHIPWNKLFTAIEMAYDKRLILSSVLPDAQQRTLVIEGLATEISPAIDFSENLKKSGVLTETHLTLEDVDEVNPYFPQQFQINAKWPDHHE